MSSFTLVITIGLAENINGSNIDKAIKDIILLSLLLLNMFFTVYSGK